MKRIYLDHAATTPVALQVAETMMMWLQDGFGNPSAVYDEGRKAKRALETARKQVAEVIGAKPREIFFTAGGTESDNWALKGLAFQNREKGRHIITSAVEHPAILNSCRFLEKQGFEVTYLPVDAFGGVAPESVCEAIRDDTILISVMTANNEVGTIQPIREIGAIAKERGILFHTDAVQAFGSMAIDVDEMNIDALSVSGHKLYGPKGTGALYLRQGIRIESLIHGGEQERRRRAGTENVPGIAGFGVAAALAAEGLEDQAERLTAFRQKLIEGVLQAVPGTVLCGHPERRLPGNAHFLIDGVDGNALLMRLDMAGIAASAGSACTAGSIEPSHVLQAMGMPCERSVAPLRLSLGTMTTEEDIEMVLAVLPEIIKDLRK